MLALPHTAVTDELEPHHERFFWIRLRSARRRDWSRRDDSYAISPRQRALQSARSKGNAGEKHSYREKDIACPIRHQRLLR